MSLKNTTSTYDFSEAGREAAYWPVYDDAYWVAARERQQQADEALVDAEEAHVALEERFMTGEDASPAELRESELLVARAKNLAEVAAEPGEWLAAQRRSDDHSITRTGKPYRLHQLHTRRGHVAGWLTEATGQNAAQRLAQERARTASRVAGTEAQYDGRVRSIEDDIAAGKVSVENAQAAADVLADEKNAAVAEARASLADFEAKRAARVEELRAELTEIDEFLATYDPAKRRTTLVRK
ncbi:hypothetical protein ACWFNS_04745 [Oerskovia enterophila]